MCDTYGHKRSKEKYKIENWFYTKKNLSAMKNSLNYYYWVSPLWKVTLSKKSKMLVRKKMLSQENQNLLTEKENPLRK